MNISKITFNGEFRIRVDFPYNQETIAKIRGVEGARWSRNLKAWHIPYKKEAFDQLKRLFPEVVYPGRPETGNSQRNGAFFEKGAGREGIRVEVLGQRILIRMPKDQTDITFIRGIRYSRWDGKQFFWVVPHYPGNLEMIREYFGSRIKELIVHEEIPVGERNGSGRTISRNEMLIIRTSRGRLKLIFAYNAALSNYIKKMPYYSWDAKNKWWTIPWSERFLEEIRDLAKTIHLEVIYEEEKQPDRGVRRIIPADIPNYRPCPDDYRNKLIELRYGRNTARVYCSMFEEFLNYHHKLELREIDDRRVIEFLQYLVMERKVSPSYQNQAINAIKFYYEKMLGLPRKVYRLDRPRTEKKLPLVLNEEEITRVIRLTKNIKHKAIIMITYSSGLRLSEVLNLKIVDIDSKRMQVFVRQSKGKKDRYTLLSKKALPVLRAYLKEHSPREWLFEGVGGGQYSKSSVESLVKDAYQRAGITKAVTVHTLRHCFGTHLLENGTDLRYIQALMGHSSSKTTEIYTHITTKGFNQIENPLDKLNI